MQIKSPYLTKLFSCFQKFVWPFIVNFILICVYFLAINFQELKAQLEERKPTLDKSKELADYLVDKNKDEPLVVAKIKDKLDKVELSYEDVRAKIIELEGNLQAAQIRTQEFQVAFGDFKKTMDEIEELVANQELVSAVFGTVKKQKESDEVCQVAKINIFLKSK